MDRHLNKQPNISVIIVNWNGYQTLERCLKSLEKQTYRNFETIVVDNFSTDRSRKILKSEWANRLELVLLDCNTGYCGGNNRGIEIAKGSLIALLNNDAETDENWLKELADAEKRNPKAGMFASKIYFASEKNRFDSTGLLVYQDGMCRSRGWLEKDKGQFENEEEVLAPNGAAAVYRKKMLEDTGLFDERYFAYLEDLDIALRGWIMGYTCIYVPTAIVYHVKSASCGIHSKQKAFYAERNRLWNLLKLFPLHLIIVSPVYTLYRYFFQAYSVFTKQGASHGFVCNYSKSELAFVLVKAVCTGLLGVPHALKKRSIINKRSRTSSKKLASVIKRFKLSTVELALKD